MQGRNAPNVDTLERYEVNRAGAHEVIWQPLYDFQTYPAAGATQLTFFALPVGQSGKTRADTNMVTAGALPAPQRFLMSGVEVVLFPGVNPGRVQGNPAAATGAPNYWNDVHQVLKSGFLELTIGSKPYLVDAPLMKFPPAFRLGGSGALADSTTAGAAQLTSIDYAVSCGALYQITPLKIPSQQNFSVTLNFPAAVPTLSGQAARIGVILDGFLYRLSQ